MLFGINFVLITFFFHVIDLFACIRMLLGILFSVFAHCCLYAVLCVLRVAVRFCFKPAVFVLCMCGSEMLQTLLRLFFDMLVHC